jgi:hypothetical protein
VELAPGLSSARCFADPASFIKQMKARISIGLKDSAKALEMGLRMFSATVGREGEPYLRRDRIGARMAITHIGPEPAGLRPSVAGCAHRNGSVVGMKPCARKHIGDVLPLRVGRARQPKRCPILQAWSGRHRHLRGRRSPTAGSAKSDRNTPTWTTRARSSST